MRHAVALGRRGLGRTRPNPAVGCVVVRGGVVVGRGWTGVGGRPHAEAVALAMAGTSAAGADVHVTLEPCCHVGRGPACADLLIAADVGRVVIAREDPDPRVAGGGIAKLRQAGVQVVVGVGADAAAEGLRGHESRVRRGRPFVTLKLAASLDGRIATAGGQSRWITGAAARAWGHLARARADAILVGVGTVIADDPELTCRLPGLADRSPERIVLDGRGRTPPTAKLVRTARAVPTRMFVTGVAATDAHVTAGVLVERLPGGADGRPEPAAVLARLAATGVGALLIEGGAAIARAFLAVDLVDELLWLRGPMVVGGDGLAAVAAMGLPSLDAVPRWTLAEARGAGPDRLERWLRQPATA
jgi:diaminohydroxyphosphoribosylaminopyrimidine deaminase/5-amino-6-(5-phosphoribosylamino)uracil reductase